MIISQQNVLKKGMAEGQPQLSTVKPRHGRNHAMAPARVTAPHLPPSRGRRRKSTPRGATVTKTPLHGLQRDTSNGVPTVVLERTPLCESLELLFVTLGTQQHLITGSPARHLRLHLVLCPTPKDPILLSWSGGRHLRTALSRNQCHDNLGTISGVVRWPMSSKTRFIQLQPALTEGTIRTTTRPNPTGYPSVLGLPTSQDRCRNTMIHTTLPLIRS